MNDTNLSKLHSFTIVTDGVAKVVKASAMGLMGSGERTVEPEKAEPIYTVAEQAAKAKAEASE